MTDLQRLIALGPVQPDREIPAALLHVQGRPLRTHVPSATGPGLTDRELSQLRALGVDLDVLEL